MVCNLLLYQMNDYIYSGSILLLVIEMPEVVVNIPEDLEFLAKVPEIELSLFVSRLLKEKLERIEYKYINIKGEEYGTTINGNR